MVESRPHLALPAARAQARDSLVPSLSSVRQWAFMGEAAAFQGSSCRAVGIQSPASWGVGLSGGCTLSLLVRAQCYGLGTGTGYMEFYEIG